MRIKMENTMKKISEIISSNVISLYEGEELGYAYNIAFDYKTKKCKYLYILNEEENLINIAKFCDIYKIGIDCIYIKNSSLIELENNNECDLTRCKSPLNLKIYDACGKYLGVCHDIEIDDNNSIISLILNEEKKIEADKIINIGSVIIVGDKKISLSKFKPDKLIKIAKTPREEKVAILDKEVEPIPKAKDSTPQNKIITDSRFLMGRKIIQDVIAFNGEMIARCGTTINKDILNKASLYGKLIEIARFSTNK